MSSLQEKWVLESSKNNTLTTFSVRITSKKATIIKALKLNTNIQLTLK